MIPVTVHPLADRRFRQTRWGEEAEMRTVEAADILRGPMPSSWQDLSNRASALYLSNMTVEALRVAESAVRQARTVPTLVNMAVILESLGRFDEALPYAREATIVDREDNRATALYGESLLRLGRFREGWPLYATERASHNWLRPYVAEWPGPSAPLANKRLLVIEGGGYGDNLYFLRWLGVLRRWGGRIDYVCQPSFAPLVRRCGYHAIENWAGNVNLDYASYDYFTSILALGHKLGVTLDNYRWEGPYVLGRRWWRRLRRPRVGLCWRAGEGRSPRKSRSLDPFQLQRIAAALPVGYGWRWVSLVPGHTFAGAVQPRLGDWAATAEVLATLDLVVTVDTGVAHLAGAMGVPTWTLLPGASAWQYPVGYATHPLYPSMECFWNGGEGISYTVENVVRRLKELA